MSSFLTTVLSSLLLLGSIDVLLTGSPQITYFRSRFQSHTPFAVSNACVELGDDTAPAGSTATAKIPRTGDLVSQVYLVVDLPGIANVTTDKVARYDEEATDQTPTSYAEVVSADMTGYNSLGDTTGHYVLSTADSSAATDRVALKTIDGKAHRGDYGRPTWCDAVGQYIIKQVQLIIGHQCIDTLYSDLIFMLEELNGKPQKRLTHMVGKTDPLNPLRNVLTNRSMMFQRLHVPIPFFFTLEPSSSLPLVALQFHDVQIKFQLEDVSKLVVNGSGMGRGTVKVALGDGTTTQEVRTVVRPRETSPTSTTNGAIAVFGESTSSLPAVLKNSDVRCQLEVMYIFLGTDERVALANMEMDLMIREHQCMSTIASTSTSNALNLLFNHAVTEILWTVRQSYYEQFNEWSNYGGVEEPLITEWHHEPIKEVKLMMNNNPRFFATDGKYFRTVMPFQHHAAVPNYGVYCYPFSLHPSVPDQPSGTFNFSRLDSARLHLTLDSALFADKTPWGGKNFGTTSVQGANIQGDHTDAGTAGAGALNTTRTPDRPGGNQINIMVYALNWNVLHIAYGLAALSYAS